jgi:hypothetical protein
MEFEDNMGLPVCAHVALLAFYYDSLDEEDDFLCFLLI